MSNDLLPIAIHGVPRSGTSWLGEILNSSPATLYKYQPLFSYRFKSFLGPCSRSSEIEVFFQQLATTADDFLDQTERRSSGSLPTFDKAVITHLAYKEVRYHHILANLLEQAPMLRLVAIIRNPLAVMASWLRAPREFRTDLGWDPIEEWRCAPSKNEGRPEDFFGFEKWKEGALMFTRLKREHPHRVHIVDYAELVTSTPSVVQALFDFCGLEVTAQTRAFLAESSSREDDDPYAVYRYRAGDLESAKWLDPRIVSAIRTDLRGGDLECFLGAAAGRL